MRKLNKNEFNLLNSDLKPMEEFFRINGLESESYIKKYNRNLSISAMTQQELGGANGIIKKNNGKFIIGLSEDIFGENRKRARALYHEFGHLLMGLNYSDERVTNIILNQIVKTKKENRVELKEEEGVYLDGLKLLEEYLVEKFSLGMMVMAKRIPEPPKVSLKTPPISGDYSYYSSFDTNYGIFESLCDKFVGKTYGNLTNSIKAGLSEKFFTGFFEKYDNIELMKILGNLGHIKRAIYAYAGQNQYQYNPEQIHRILDDTNELVDNIQTRSQSHHINPEDISNAGRNVLHNNPGALSSGMRKSHGLFSRIFNRTKSQEK